MNVSPIWVTARNRPGCCMSRRTRRAEPLPSSTSCSTRVRRIVTSAISAATKTPSSSVRRTMTRIWRTVPSAARRRLGGAGRPPSGFRPAVAASAVAFVDPSVAPERRRPAPPGGTSCVTTAPAPVFAPVAHRHRRDEHRVDAEERALADRRGELARAVVVRGDRAGTDVRVAARRARRRDTRSDAGGRRARAGSSSPPRSCRAPRRARSTSPAAGARTARSGPRPRPRSPSRTLAQTTQSRPIVGVHDLRPGADAGPLPDRRPAAQDHVRLQRRRRCPASRWSRRTRSRGPPSSRRGPCAPR